MAKVQSLVPGAAQASHGVAARLQLRKELTQTLQVLLTHC